MRVVKLAVELRSFELWQVFLEIYKAASKQMPREHGPRGSGVEHVNLSGKAPWVYVSFREVR